MKMANAFLVTSVLTLAAPAWSQQSPTNPQTVTPTRDSPRPDQLEPGVDTSATPATSTGATTDGTTTTGAAATGKAPSKVKGGAVSATPASRASAPIAPAADAASGASSAAPGAPAAPGTPLGGTQGLVPAALGAPPKSGAGGKAQDRLELDTTQITGNRELPKVLYIVPWKRSDLGDLVGKPVNSLLDEVLAPVDRDVFKRENRYYDALKPDAGAAATPGK